MSWSTIIIEILKAIAAPVAAILVGILAFVGVSFQLYWHAKSEKSRREHEMLRDAHFKMAEAIVKSYISLRRHCALTTTETELQLLMADFPVAAARMHLVGSLQSINNLHKFTKIFAAALFVLTPMRGRLMSLKENYDRKIEQIKEINNQIRVLSLTADPRLASDYQRLSGLAGTVGKEAEILWNGIIELNLKMAIEAQNQIEKFSHAQIEGVIIAREALKLNENFSPQNYRFDAEKEAQELNEMYLAYLKTLEPKKI